MEKVRLANGNEYGVIPGGVQRKTGIDGSDQLRLLIADQAGVSFDSVESDFQAEENTASISYIGVTGSVEEVISGYGTLKSVEKCKDCLIGHDARPLEGGGYQMDEVRGSVYAILLSRDSLQTQLDRLKETVDVMVLSALEAQNNV